MSKEISKRCGKGTCQYYDKHNKVSGCTEFTDRRDCSMSLSQRRRVQNSSRKNQRENWMIN